MKPFTKQEREELFSGGARTVAVNAKRLRATFDALEAGTRAISRLHTATEKPRLELTEDEERTLRLKLSAAFRARLASVVAFSRDVVSDKRGKHWEQRRVDHPYEWRRNGEVIDRLSEQACAFALGTAPETLRLFFACPKRDTYEYARPTFQVDEVNTVTHVEVTAWP